LSSGGDYFQQVYYKKHSGNIGFIKIVMKYSLSPNL